MRRLLFQHGPSLHGYSELLERKPSRYSLKVFILFQFRFRMEERMLTYPITANLFLLVDRFVVVFPANDIFSFYALIPVHFTVKLIPAVRPPRRKMSCFRIHDTVYLIIIQIHVEATVLPYISGEFLIIPGTSKDFVIEYPRYITSIPVEVLSYFLKSVSVLPVSVRLLKNPEGWLAG